MSESIRAVERALDVLSCFSSKTPDLSMTQISEIMNMNKSTVHRLLATLEERRYVLRDQVTGRYQPGNRLLQLAFLTLDRNGIREIAAPFMLRLKEMHRETITLSTLDDTDMVYINVLESPQSVKLAAKPGQRLPVFCTASGKVLMAYSSDDFVKKVLGRELPQYTPFTIRDLETTFHIMDLVRERGFAYSEQEYEEGINAVAAPILGKNNSPIASIAVAGPAYRLTVERMLSIGPSVASIAIELSKEIAGST
jgi:DNA-binding IclR family transcriptional regulator